MLEEEKNDDKGLQLSFLDVIVLLIGMTIALHNESEPSIEGGRPFGMPIMAEHVSDLALCDAGQREWRKIVLLKEINTAGFERIRR